MSWAWVGSIRYICPDVLLRTHTNPPPTAIAFGAAEKPSAMAEDAVVDDAWTDWTVPSSEFATQAVSSWAATAPGFRPTKRAPAPCPPASPPPTDSERG